MKPVYITTVTVGDYSVSRDAPILDHIKTSPFVVPTTLRTEALTGKASLGDGPLQAVTNESFSSGRGKSSNRGSRACFRPHPRG